MVQAGGSSSNAKMARLVQELVQGNVIKSQRVANVMKLVDRGQFVTQESSRVAYQDSPQSIEHNVTISAPHMHAYCMEWLEPKLQPGASVLDVGCGSGYLLATFYELCKNPSDGKAHIYGIEHVEELAEFSRVNVRKAY